MDNDVWFGNVFFIIIDDRGEKFPFRCGHGTLNQMIFGVNLVGHDESGVDNDGRLLEHLGNFGKFFDAG